MCYDTRVLTIPETENQISKGTKWLKTEILCTFLCNYLVDNEEIYTRWAEEHLTLGGRNLCQSLIDTSVHIYESKLLIKQHLDIFSDIACQTLIGILIRYNLYLKALKIFWNRKIAFPTVAFCASAGSWSVWLDQMDCSQLYSLNFLNVCQVIWYFDILLYFDLVSNMVSV